MVFKIWGKGQSASCVVQFILQEKTAQTTLRMKQNQNTAFLPTFEALFSTEHLNKLGVQTKMAERFRLITQAAVQWRLPFCFFGVHPSRADNRTHATTV